MALNKNPKIDIKRKYTKCCEIGLILALIITIAAFLYFPEIKRAELIIPESQELVDIEDVNITKQESAPPPPPQPIIPIEIPTDEVLEDIIIEDTELDITENVETLPPPIVEEKEEEVQPNFFIAVEEMPEPIGGIEGIQNKIVYPEIAKRAGIQGKVYILAFVDEFGDVKKVEILKGIGAGCDEAAVKAVLQTKFKPGKQRGKPVKVQVSIPVRFVLNPSV
ncbi:MAG: energy transducer TonB [Ignavibacteriales bacterium]|nr:energy transducer TonB [Ignavibacteriales bacterium]